MTTTSISPIPKDQVSAIRELNWKNAMLDEYNALIDNHTWDLVPRPPNVNVIRPMWIFRHKRNSDGSFERYKARLVADGKTHWMSRMLFYMAPRAWYQRFADFFTSIGFANSKSDNYLFIFRQGSDTAYILLYVDDIILTASSDSLRTRIMDLLGSEFAMKDLGPLSFFLGIVVTREVVMLMEGMSNCSPCPTPVDTKSKLSASHDDPYEDPTKYRSLAGAFQYLTFTRPDISYAVQQVCLHMHDPRNAHMGALKRIIRYLQGTLSFGLHLYKSSINQLRQPTLSKSSAKAEYRGVANVVSDSCWIRNLLLELYFPIRKATIV
ncbi:uncharacterized protein LOC110686999 [Chenopodium quinoa]|uniref:uncharacterized protein LOC110686999 n=1 Tax=Chenopodium quinoa TaxID=63459 RepID=UPI000B770EA3|nr:uncharacterized protein LOC110686999 [Chenopodium quinoa]